MDKYSEQAKNVFNFLGTLSKESPKIAEGFSMMHQATSVDGAISGKHKKLMAIGIAIAIRCEGCISLHMKGAIEAGATKDEILETIGVAILMGGGPSITYGNKAHEAMIEMM
ncbi:MAG: carboxymuconolactone decarboxylase family protein [Bacteroidales bacterium]|nr:carboxymuconolactone decarboxylase family protein [Bacteroidales bacterium]